MSLDWSKLRFSFLQTNGVTFSRWKDGSWSTVEYSNSSTIPVHIAATALHYGQSAIEGLKAFKGQDGLVRVFRSEEHCQRLGDTADRVLMPGVPLEIFDECIRVIIKKNLSFVPPYDSGGALYVRPLLFGSSPRIGVRPADEYIFAVIVVPVGDYYEGKEKPVTAIILDDFDRAAPQGLGGYKVAGNYAAGLYPMKIAMEKMANINLFLDAKEHRYVEEFSTSNFIGITKAGHYVTPVSSSVLPSVTNKTLMILAEDLGMKVEKRQVPFDELSEMREWGACGTAVVITPVHRIVRGPRTLESPIKTGMGPKFSALYKEIRGIQRAEVEDRHGWLWVVD